MQNMYCWEYFKDKGNHDCKNCPVSKGEVGTICYIYEGTRCFGEVQGKYNEKIKAFWKKKLDAFCAKNPKSGVCK